MVKLHLLPLLLGLVATAFLVGRVQPDKRVKLRPSAITFLGFAGASLGSWAAAALGWSARSQELHWVAGVLEALCAIGLLNTAFFHGILPVVRLRVPVFVSDVAAGLAYLFALLHRLHEYGLNTSSLLATSAVVSGVVGLSLAPTLGNLLGGFALQLDDSLREGDWIQLDAQTAGRVTAIRWRHTLVETRGWDTVVVPNAVLLQGHITVLGRRSEDPRRKRYQVPFELDARHPPEAVQRAVDEALSGAPVPRVAPLPAPHAVCLELPQGSHPGRTLYAVRYWLQGDELEHDETTSSRVRARIHAGLCRGGFLLEAPRSVLELVPRTAQDHTRLESEELSRRMALLHRVALFDTFTREERSALAPWLVPAPYADGERITEQGRTAHWLYLLTEGRVDVVVRLEDGREAHVQTLTAPNYFGEMGCMTGAPRSATVRALGPVRCYKLERDAFQSLIAERPAIAQEVSAVIAARQGQLLQVRRDHGATRPPTADEDPDAVLRRIKAFFGLG
ncbi:MAG: mechanosensitive ion channel family protein [Deltaproteobacteria bacterium]|nr:mechanosensitive ion channel family protein [Deltaproteobacteria bacterium]